MTMLLFVVVAVLPSLLVFLAMRARRDVQRPGSPDRTPQGARDERQLPVAGSLQALDVPGRIAEFEREFGSLPDRQLRDRGANG